MRPRRHVAVKALASLLLCGLFAGVVVAAAVFPGLAAKSGADTFEDLPTDLDVLPSPQISYIYASDGATLLAMMYDENRRDVPIADMSTFVTQAIVAAEDTRFYEHQGVDLKGVARAFVNNENGGDQQGASTLTMQYVRQATAYSAQSPQDVLDATSKTTGRKLREMKLAMALEKKLTKQQILERYLNISAFGHGAYGVYAASQVYFGKAPKDLTLGESALLAGLVKAPSTNDPATPDGLPKALGRQTYVLDQMVSMHYITAQQRDQAKAEKLTIVGQRTPEGCASVQRPELGAGFLCDYLRRWWLEQPAFGADAFERENRLRSGGYTIVSSLNVQTQAAAFKYAQDQPGLGGEKIGMGNPEAVMIAAVEPGTGRVQALATNRNFSNDQTHNGASTSPARKGQKGNYPNTTVPLITGGPDVPGYQGGSTFKIFTAVAAMEAGLPLAHTEDVQAQFVSDYPLNAESPAACNGPHYCPKNSTGDPTGTFNMWQGFGMSLNTYFVPLEQRVGADHVVDVAKRLGIQFRSPQDAGYAKNAKTWGAFTLGVTDTTPLDLAGAYAALDADGVYCAPTPVVEIHDLHGNKVDAGQPRCRQVVAPDIARAAVDMARCPVGDQSAYNACPGSGTATGVRDQVGRPVAGKTGTTDSGRSATFIAMTPQLAVAGILTDPDNPQTNKVMSHPVVNTAVADTLKAAMNGLKVEDFTAPSHQMAFGS
ncbi:transglycosylase domain-containing protein [Dactylosporangium sp. NPDC051485]|uniref:transglycosylase domain-containing protein n=1 Tax=Dactylosporangium sp. NPDC051485 TaxID=3154846 RepID=UPI003412B5E5